MSTRSSVGIFILAVLCVLAAPLASKDGRTVLAAGENTPAAPSWDKQAAERYLDGREVWWQAWTAPRKITARIAFPATRRPRMAWRGRCCANRWARLLLLPPSRR